MTPVTHRQVNFTIRRLESDGAGEIGVEHVPPSLTRRRAECLGERTTMVMWPAVTLIGFLVLTALVVAMGMSSTARYEAERAEGTPAGSRQSGAEALSPVSA